MEEIKIENITKKFGDFTALDSISLSIEKGQFCVLLGPSGCGKTTLLRIIAGLEKVSAGKVFIGSDEVTKLSPKNRNIGMVFQNYALFPHMNVFNNVSFGLRMKKLPQKEIEEKVQKALSLMHIEDFAKRLPSQLSSGQKQRVEVARAIATEPRVLLMDEPLSNLDALLRLEMRTELKALLAGETTTTVYVTHDQLEAMSLGDNIAIMQQGQIIQNDKPKTIYRYPVNMTVGGLIGTPPMNYVKISNATEETKQIIQRAYKPPTENLKAQYMGIRPEDITISLTPQPNYIMATVLVIENLGANLQISARLGPEQVRIITNVEINTFSETIKIYLQPNIEKICWYDEDGKLIQV